MTVTLHELPLDQIRPHPRNIRRELGDLTELTSSIRAQGVLEPVRVSPDGDPNAYWLSAGHRRLAAAELAGLETIPALVSSQPLTDAQVIEEMLVENGQRSDLSPIEEADAYQQLSLLGDYDTAQIARVTGRSVETVRRRMALLELPEQVRDGVHAGQLTLAQAEAIGAFADDAKTLDKLYKAAGRDDGGQDLRWQLSSAQRDRERAADHAEEIAHAKDAGVAVLDERPKGSVPLYETGMDSGDHAQKCDGHALVDYGSYLGAVCTTPKAHKAKAKRLSKPEREAAAAERQLAEDLEVAAKIRREWITELLSSAHKPSNPQVEIMLRQVLLSLLEAGWFEPDTGSPLDSESIDQVVDGWKTPQLAQGLYAAAVAAGDELGVHLWERQNLADRVRRYQVLGYQPTEVERRLVDEVHTERAEQAARETAEAEDAGDAEDEDGGT